MGLVYPRENGFRISDSYRSETVLSGRGFWHYVMKFNSLGLETSPNWESQQIFIEQESLRSLLFLRLDELLQGKKDPLALLEIFYLEISLQFLDFPLALKSQPGLNRFQSDDGEGNIARLFCEIPNLPYRYYPIPNSPSYVLIHNDVYDHLTSSDEINFLEYLLSYFSKFKLARKRQIEDFISTLKGVDRAIIEFINLTGLELFFRDLVEPPFLLVVPSLTEAGFFQEVFRSAIRRWENTRGVVDQDRWMRVYAKALGKIPPHAKIYNWGLVFVNSRSKSDDQEPDEHCYLRYVRNYNEINPFTGERLSYPNTYDHEGCGHGIFELIVLSVFSFLILEASKKFDFPKIEKDQFLSQLRTSTIFGEAFAGFFGNDPRCLRFLNDQHYSTFTSVLNQPCVFDDNRRRYSFNYIAGPRFWMSIELALQFFLDWSRVWNNHTPEEPTSVEFSLNQICQTSSDLDLRMSVKRFLFLKILETFYSVFQDIRTIAFDNCTNLSELAIELANLCLRRLLARLESLGIDQTQIEKIYNLLGSLNSNNIDIFLSEMLGSEIPDELAIAITDFLRARFGFIEYDS